MIEGPTAWGRHLLAVAAVALLAAACGSTAPDPGEEPGGDVCQAASDCADDQICRMGYCTRRSAHMEDIRFQFIPPQASGYSPQTSRGVTVRADERLDFVLEPNVTVDGTISFEDADNSSVGPSGPLTFKRKNRDDTLFDVQTRVEDGTFQAMVLPGKYDLVFAPDNYPSRVWPDRSFTANADLTDSDDLTVPAESELATIQGTVVFRARRQPESAEPKKVPSARVLAVSSDGRYTTTIDTTSAGTDDGGAGTEGPGHFVLRAVAGSGSYDLVINPGSETLLPKMRVPDAFTVDADGSDIYLSKEKTNLGTHPAGAASGDSTTLSFELAAPGDVEADEIDWARTRIVARANPEDLGGDGGVRQFRRETSAVRGGKVELALLPARYTIWVYPPADAPLASTKIELDLTEGALETFSDWRLKRPLEGRVVDPSGEPVPGALLEFWPENLSDEKFHDRLKVTATTDADGSFSVMLEPRRHRLTVRPPSGSGLPRHWATIQKDELGGRRRLQLPEPVLLRGSVRGASGRGATPIADTTISATISNDGERRILGKTTADAEGRFYMIVPALD